MKLVEMGVPIDWWPSNDENGQTALMRAVCHGNTLAVELLLRLGANANPKGANDITPLMCAVSSRNGHVSNCLLMQVPTSSSKWKMDYQLLTFYRQDKSLSPDTWLNW